MFGIFAYYHDDSLTLDYLAFIADFLYGWFDFHFITIPFLFCTPCDTAFGKIVYRYFYRYFVSGQYPDIVHPELSRYMSCYYMSVGELYLEGGVRQCLQYRSFKLHYIIFCQNYPSKPLRF